MAGGSWWLIMSWFTTLQSVREHRWFSGRMLACHAGGPGSIPGRCNQFCKFSTNKHKRSKYLTKLAEKDSRSVGFEPTPAERNWFLVSRLNHSATTAELQGWVTSTANIEKLNNKLASLLWQSGVKNISTLLSCHDIRESKIFRHLFVCYHRVNNYYQIFSPLNYSSPASSVGRAWDS